MPGPQKHFNTALSSTRNRSQAYRTQVRLASLRSINWVLSRVLSTSNGGSAQVITCALPPHKIPHLLPFSADREVIIANLSTWYWFRTMSMKHIIDRSL